MLKELELESNPNQDNISYHVLYMENGEIHCQTAPDLKEINHNSINDTFDSLMIRTIGNGCGDDTVSSDEKDDHYIGCTIT